MNTTSRDGGDTLVVVPSTQPCKPLMRVVLLVHLRLSQIRISSLHLRKSRCPYMNNSNLGFGQFSVVATHGLCSNWAHWNEGTSSDVAITTLRPSVVLNLVQDTCFIDFPFNHVWAQEFFWSWSSLFRRQWSNSATISFNPA